MLSTVLAATDSAISALLQTSPKENMMMKLQPNYSRTDKVLQEYLITTRTYYFLLGCIFAAAAFNGLSGSGMNRVLVEMPAWQHVGALAWAAFSRWADNGTTGLILYPFEKIGGTLFSIAAAIIFFANRRHLPRSGALPIYGAALFALGSLLATTQAAPLMLSTPHISDLASLQRVLNGFEFWEGIRAGVQVLTFCSNLWALVVVSHLHTRSRETSA
jgi:hypothetical protein